MSKELKRELPKKNRAYPKILLGLILGIGLIISGSSEQLVWGISGGTGYNFFQNVGIIETVTTEASDYFPGTTLYVTTRVRNSGTWTLHNVQVLFRFKNPDNAIAQIKVAIIPSITAGSTANTSASYTLSTEPLEVDGTWTVTVSPVGSANSTDNTFNVWRTVNFDQYKAMAKQCADYMDANYSGGYHTYPNNISVSDGRTVSLAQEADILARVLRYYQQNGALPGYVKIRACTGPSCSVAEPNSWMWQNEGRSDDSQVTWYDTSSLWDSQHNGPEYSLPVPSAAFLDGCVQLANYIDTNNTLPNNVTVYNTSTPARWESIPICQFLYSMSRYIRYYVNNGGWPSTVGTRHMTVPQNTSTWEQNPDE